jgi:ATP-dependent exoDNAse (exonuclease V) beta subunit
MMDELPPLQIQLAPSRTAGLAGLTAVQPSRHSVHTVRLEDVLPSSNSIGRAFGTLIHAWFEQVDWLDDGPPAEEVLLRAERRLEPHLLDVEDCRRNFRRMLKHPAVAAVLSRKTYLAMGGIMAPALTPGTADGDVALRVQQERHFAVPLGAEFVRGCIDRLVLLVRGDEVLAADIVDYKTDAVDSLNPEVWAERVKGYRQQLRLYQRAVAHLYDLSPDRVTARLVFLGPGQVESVSTVEEP